MPILRKTRLYDMFNNLIGRTYTNFSDSSLDTAQYFVYDGTNMVLAFNGSQQLTDRYLSGPAVDQVLADEHFVAGSSGESGNNGLPRSAGTTYLSLADNQGSVTDVVNDTGADLETSTTAPSARPVSPPAVPSPAGIILSPVTRGPTPTP